jgi:threonine dehydrogenase-like Zn-dependent dehydrogenase
MDHGVDTIDLREVDDVAEEVRSRTSGRGADSVVDAVGMEAHGSPLAAIAQRAAGLMPRRLGASMMQRAGIDRMAAFHSAIDAVRRGGTISLSGVYGGQMDPLPMLTLFDKQVTLRMGQANVRRWIDDLMPLLTDDDPLDVDRFATHRMPLDEAPRAYADFQHKTNGTVKVVFEP